MITDSENLTDSGDSSTVRWRGETARFIMVKNNTQLFNHGHNVFCREISAIAAKHDLLEYYHYLYNLTSTILNVWRLQCQLCEAMVLKQTAQYFGPFDC